MLEEFHQQTRLQLRVLHQQRSGPGRARNAGVALARFNWIGLLDADVQADQIGGISVGFDSQPTKRRSY